MGTGQQVERDAGLEWRKIKEEGLVESRGQDMRHSVERRVPEPAKELNWGVSELQGPLELSRTKATGVHILSSLSPPFACRQAELFSRTCSSKAVIVESKATGNFRS